LAEISLGHVGIVFGREMSRLARSNRDWHQLLELCGLFQVLLADADGVYDPRDVNDRLLLGLKGTLSEAETHVLRSRLHQGKLNELLRHPAYAGAYAYGRQASDAARGLPGRPKPGRHAVPPEEWACFLKDRIPAYIGWERYEENRRRLRENDRGRGASRAAT